MTTLAAAAALTLGFTAVLTIAGVGAAFILIPVFIALGVELHAAMATALLLNGVAMAVASVRSARRGLIEYRLALPILIVAIVFSPVGAWVSQRLDRAFLLGLFVAFLLFAGGMMLLHRGQPGRSAPAGRRVVTHGSVVGALVGFIGGLLGVGGGNILVPALVWLGVEPKRAAATTAFVVVFSSLAGFLGHATLSGVDPALIITTAVCSAAGALIGSYLMTDRLRGPQVRAVLGVVLIGLAVKIGWGLVR
jgi:uncharacterized membrane protein YfcA